MKNLKSITRIGVLISALIMLISFFVPIWQILMWAPQYPEGLEMKIWLHTITGDYKIISGLNHYIGMKHIDVDMFPEFNYMRIIVGVLIASGLIVVLLNKRAFLYAYCVLIILVGIVGMVDFYKWGYDYGHNLDPTAPIIVPGMAYQPPLIGTKQLLNFTAFSGPDIGGYVFLVSGLLAVAFSIIEMRSREAIKKPVSALLILMAVSFASCSTGPEPISFGKDGCAHCKMIMMDNRFGAEVVTTKGKIYKFDDSNCMKRFIGDGAVQQEDIKSLWIINYAEPEKLIDLSSAILIRSEAIKSPMAGNVAAFNDKAVAEKFNQQWRGEPTSWQDIQ